MKYEIIVVGGGHAGCEAALAASRKGHKTLLITGNIKNIADTPCNPSIGGPGKGVVVREIDALGGEMGKNTDKSILQIKKLNTKKGPAVQALRAQIDKTIYPQEMLKTLQKEENLEIKENIVENLIIENNTIKAVITKGGDYCVALKANQANFYKDVQDYFDGDRLMIIESGYEGGYQLTREKSHEAVITYEYYQTEKVKWYADCEKWEGLKSIGLVRKTIEKSDGSKVEEKRYYISSLLLDINIFSDAIRKHWNVENKLHWQMDFTFKSDNNTTMNKKALFNLQIIKKFCLTVLNEIKKVKNKSLKRIRKDISRNVEKETIEIFKLLRNFDTTIIS